MGIIYEIEKLIKGPLFDCQNCGQCVLSHTGLICPMNCPKGLRNGPCGGTLNGKCEVFPERECVWLRIDSRKSIDPDTVHAPVAPELFNSASYVNFFNGKDRETRLPQPVIENAAIASTSDLANKMYRGEFVVTLEIASPRTREGLTRVERTMQGVAEHVDAVNTTTNAGGVPSLHSMETAKVVTAHGVESVIQFCGRDETPEEFIGSIEEAVTAGHGNFLFLTGDWPPDTERAVNQDYWFPMDSLQMVHLVNKRLPEFQERFGAVPFIGVASNPFTTPMETSVQRLHNKRHAGARFSQTQAITNVGVYAEWYKELRRGREDEPRLTIPSVPLVGSRRAFEVLCRLPGIYVDPSLHQVMENESFQRPALEWAFKIAEGVTENGAAGVHVMNFGMPPELIREFLVEIRSRADEARDRAGVGRV
ncbi:MAG TPA: methylenetetrahydrofolate reductase C-terminal domain-containing protein [Rhodothermales bacterium]|nr:methylenetetrahydrofolate reductase C-terminal domain-containing protein [Rhodothermales bacterium]